MKHHSYYLYTEHKNHYTVLVLWYNLRSCVTDFQHNSCWNLFGSMFSFSMREIFILCSERITFFGNYSFLFLCNSSIFRAALRFPGRWWVTACRWKAGGQESGAVWCYVCNYVGILGRGQTPIEQRVFWLTDTRQLVRVNFHTVSFWWQHDMRVCTHGYTPLR